MKITQIIKTLPALTVAIVCFAAPPSAQGYGGIFGYGLEVRGTGAHATNSGITTLYALNNGGTTRLLPLGSPATLNQTAWNNGTPQAPILNLGTFSISAGDTLTLLGGSMLTYQGGGDTVGPACYLNYTVDHAGGPYGSFGPGILLLTNEVNVSGNAGDIRWSDETRNINLLSGLAPGTYILESYGYAASTAGNQYANNSGHNYGAVFTVVSNYSDCPAIQLSHLAKFLVKNVASSQSITALGGVAPYTYTNNAGSLPPGLSLSTGGVLSGTPTTIGQYSFTVMAKDANGCTGSRVYTVQVFGSGADNSENYPNFSWTNRSNAGSGFAAWELYGNNHGGTNSFAGYEESYNVPNTVNIQAGDNSVWKLYAKYLSGPPWVEGEAYRKFNTPLSVAGDTFVLSFQNGAVGTPGQVGFALRNGDDSGSGGFNGRARLQVYFNGGDTNLTVQDASGARQIAGLGYTTNGWDVVVTLGAAGAYSATITRYNGAGTADTPVLVTGTLAGSGPIDSLAMFNWYYNTTSGVNDDAYFNNVAYTSTTTVITNNVKFNVDMTVQIWAGNFLPATEIVEVHGTFSDWLGVTLTNNPSLSGNASNVYSGVIPIAGAPNSGESYWFSHFNTNVTPATFAQESQTPKVSTPDSGPPDYNRFLLLPNAAATVLSAVLFSDLNTNDYLPVATAVTFTVNMNGAIGTDGHVFSPLADAVYINGPFANYNGTGNWYPWAGGVNPPTAPPGFQMIEQGATTIYTNTIIMPAGTPVDFDYKYGIDANSFNGDPTDNEAPFGSNHNRVVRSTATGSYTMPVDIFGQQYHEPFFSVASTAAAQLMVGAPSGGTVPVSWLGRPGAHLQSATDLAGSWTDYPNTDGANWSSGVGTTNGLLSVTNWPSSGNRYFRLVKP